ncbi:MAG: FAD-binding oxidoreductase [Polyangiaceae bacterium]|nr:FAD-binding oxidoreductase [Polyangiaceae bacterium]
MIEPPFVERADVVVIGAGVIGASVAYHLARRRAGSILVVDREASPGLGSTGRATGGYRAQYSTEINIRLSLVAREALRRFSDETGVDPGYRPVGYLWIATTSEEFDDLARANALQKTCGLDEAILLNSKEVHEKNPFVHRRTIVGGAFCQTDGFIRPLDILRGYVEAAKRLGVKFLPDVTIAGFDRSVDGKIHTLLAHDGRVIQANAVVDAGGAWAQSIAKFADVDLPVVPLRRQVALTEPCNRLPDDMPLTIFMNDGFHLRVRDGRVMLLWPTPGRTGDPFCTDVDPDWLERIAEIAPERIPCLAGVRIDSARSWAGLYEMSPDKHAILGPAPGCQNLYLVNGSSGHGVMHAPALGKLLAEMIVDGKTSTLDTSALRPSRFVEGDLIEASDRL